MITNLIRKNVNVFEYILMGLLGFIILFTGITTFGSFGDSVSGNFGTILGFVIYIGLIGLLVYCIASNRKEYTKFLAFAYLAYYAINTILSISGPFWAFREDVNGLSVTEAVFTMLSIFAFIAFVALAIIQKIKGTNFQFVLDILAISYLGCQFLVWIFALCVDAKYKAGWVTAMSEFTQHLLLPWSVVVGYYLYQIKYVFTPQDEAYVSFDKEEDTIEDKPVTKK